MSGARWLLPLLVVACTDGDPPISEPPPTVTGVEDTAETPGDTAVEDTAVLDTGTPPPHPPCDGTPVTETLTLLGDERGDFAGRWVDAADIDGDGCDEVMVSEPWTWGYHGVSGTIHSAVHLLQDPWQAGVLGDVSYATYTGSGHDGSLDYFGDPAILLPGAGQIAIAGVGHPDDLDHPIHTYALPARAPAAPIPVVDQAGTLRLAPPFNQLGYSQLSPCTTTAGTDALCSTTIHSTTEVVGDWAGTVLMHDAPITGEVHMVNAARAHYLGDPGDDARGVHGSADLDGDGRADLIVGAWSANGGTGALALLHDPPDGTHRLWDVADATVLGTEPGAELGLSIATGDLDGDGHVDIVAGAPIGAGQAYVLSGPFTGERSVADAGWTVTGTVSPEWVGYSNAITDLDGDGAADLAVGAPWSVYLAQDPGQVAIFHAPVPGSYGLDDATLTLTSGLPDPDAYGMAIDAGDFDGDGLGDLVIGSPLDPRPGAAGGAAHLVFGASLP